MNRTAAFPVSRLIALMILSLATTSCEEVDLPVSVDPEFPIFQIRTLAPAEGSSLQAGSGQQQYQIEITYQRTQPGQVTAYFWLETAQRLQGQNVWQGDLAFESSDLANQRGLVTLNGSFRMPRISPFCGPMTHVRAVTILDLPEGTETEARTPESQLSNKESLSQDFLVTSFPVTSQGTLTDPCVITLESLVQVSNRFLFQWGQPVWIWGQRMPVGQGPRVEFAGGESIDFTIPIGGEVDPDASGFDAWQLVQTWVPTNATDGAVRVYFDDVETDYGNDRNPVIAVDEEAGDFFEPNDTPEMASDDPIDFGGGIYAVNPGLTIDDVDLIPNESLPLGDPWGQGDWWNVRTSGSVEVCGVIFMDPSDDQDLILFDASLNALDGDFSVGTEYALVSGNSNGAENMKLWITPYDVQTNDRRYELWAVDCQLIFGASSAVEMAGAPGSLDRAEETKAKSRLAPLTSSSGVEAQQLRRAIERIRSGDLKPEEGGSVFLERAAPPSLEPQKSRTPASRPVVPADLPKRRNR